MRTSLRSKSVASCSASKNFFHSVAASPRRLVDGSTASLRLSRALLTLFTLFMLASAAFAQPGIAIPSNAEVGDQKAGSVLFYNFYTSNIVSPGSQNTRINITNSSTTSSVSVKLLFVEGVTCLPADAIICLTPNQTATFLASDVDPGTSGYLVAVAIDTITGCPISFNFLSGNEYVKLATGHESALAAETFAALYSGTLPGCNVPSITAVLSFDGVTGYNRAPRTLVLDKLRSLADGNSPMLILNRVGGNLATGASTVGAVFGQIYDDAGVGYNFTFTAAACQFRSALSNSFPITSPVLSTIIPAGRTGWMNFSAVSDFGLLGAVINFNPNTSPTAFRGGHNLRKTTFTTTAALITVPVFPPSC